MGWQHTPATSRADQVAHGVDHLAELHPARATPPSRLRHQKGNQLPLLVRHIRWVALRLPGNPSHSATTLVCPHPRLESQSRSAVNPNKLISPNSLLTLRTLLARSGQTRGRVRRRRLCRLLSQAWPARVCGLAPRAGDPHAVRTVAGPWPQPHAQHARACRRAGPESAGALVGGTLRGALNGRGPGGRAASPYDSDARFRSKSGTSWMGSMVHLARTCDEGMPPGNVHEAQRTAPPQPSTSTASQRGSPDGRSHQPAHCASPHSPPERSLRQQCLLVRQTCFAKRIIKTKH